MVLDVNDNAPVFLNDSYSATISEANYSTSNLLLATVSGGGGGGGGLGLVGGGARASRGRGWG